MTRGIAPGIKTALLTCAVFAAVAQTPAGRQGSTGKPAAVATVPVTSPAASPRPASDPESPRSSVPVVELFSPQGTVKGVRRVTARFSTPMVALGDPRLPDPFVSDCPASGKGRWVDARNWVYDFDADLRAGLRCSFTLKSKLISLDKRPVGGARRFVFDTGSPAIEASLPHEGSQSIDEEQVFLLRLDAPVTPEVMRRNTYCSVEGIAGVHYLPTPRFIRTHLRQDRSRA